MPSIEIPDIKPSLADWTLRLKHHKTTILISATPQTEFQVIKKQLLAILTSIYPSGEFNGHKIPYNPEDVILGAPRDTQDIHQGWTEIVNPEQNMDGTSQTGRKRKIGGKRSVLNSPQGVGLKDGAVLAFKFKEGGNGRAEKNAKLEDMDIEDAKWDVVVPNFEDEYGSQS